MGQSRHTLWVEGGVHYVCMCPTPSIREKLKESTQTNMARQPGQRRAQTRGWIESIKGRSIETPRPQTQCKCRARRLGTIQRGCVESRCGGGGLMADGDDEGGGGWCSDSPSQHTRFDRFGPGYLLCWGVLQSLYRSLVDRSFGRPRNRMAHIAIAQVELSIDDMLVASGHPALPDDHGIGPATPIRRTRAVGRA